MQHRIGEDYILDSRYAFHIFNIGHSLVQQLVGVDHITLTAAEMQAQTKVGRLASRNIVRAIHNYIALLVQEQERDDPFKSDATSCTAAAMEVPTDVDKTSHSSHIT